MFRRALLLMLVLLGISLPAWSQGVQFIGQANANILGSWRPVPGASVRVCQSGSVGNPCSPLATIYTNAALTNISCLTLPLQIQMETILFILRRVRWTFRSLSQALRRSRTSTFQYLVWSGISNCGGGGGPLVQTFLTSANETATLPNSRQVQGGTNVTLDTSVPGRITINAAGASGCVPTGGTGAVQFDSVGLRAVERLIW